jgi:competence protein ComEC
VLVAVHFLPPRAPSPCFHLFAIGHGQCAMAELADGTTVVIDCGSLQHPFLPPKKVAAALRVRRIDLLVLTHGDRDHVGSVPSLLEQADVGLACVPAEMLGSPPVRLLAAKGAAVRGLRNGEHVAFGAAAVISRPTPAAGPHSDNDSSLWVRLDLSGTSVLVPGDPEDRGIDAAIAAGIAAPSEVLVLPHHGRRNGRTAALLRSVRPQLCCVSNRAGEGGSAQGEIAAGAGLPVLATGERGDLCVRPGPTGCRAEAEFAAPPAAH